MRSELDIKLSSAINFVHANDCWKLHDKHVWLELTNHVLRIIIQNNNLQEFKIEFEKLIECQRPDGGWPEYNDGEESGIRVTAFSTQMLLRANLLLDEELFAQSVKKGIDFLLRNQNLDGSWKDQRWHQFDATSVPVGTLLFATRQSWSLNEYQLALEKGIAFIKRMQSNRGLWEVKRGVSTIESTAHLLQKLITSDSSKKNIAKGINALIACQDNNGSWCNNIDATCDVVRCLLYFSLEQHSDTYYFTIDSACREALTWLMGSIHEGRFTNINSLKKSVLLACDFIDTGLKYIFYEEKSTVMRALYC